MIRRADIKTYLEINLCDILDNFYCKINNYYIPFFQLQVTGLSWNSTGSVIAASYPCKHCAVAKCFVIFISRQKH